MTNRFKNLGKPDMTGTLVVASPYITNYQPTVLFILQDNEQGVFAANLSEGADTQLVEAWRETTGQSIGEQTLVKGGSQPGPVFAIHSNPTLSEKTITHEIFLSTQTDSINELAMSDVEELKIVFGIESFDRNELVAEIENGVWYAIDAEPDLIFSNPEHVWYHSVRQYGANTLANVVGIQFFPDSPIMN